MAGRGRQRTSFGKLQREQACQEKQAAKARSGTASRRVDPEGPRESSVPRVAGASDDPQESE
jgi:hypothetical protein